jgi:FkbM family methyltransferase
MTLYYILAHEKIIDVENLLEPNNGVVFLNNINNGEGYEYKQQYRLKNNILDISFNNDQCNIYDEINNKTLTLFNIHFQGGAKRFMTEELIKSLPNKLVKIGTYYGGWYVPSFMKLNENSVIYSGGVGEDMSFDLLLHCKYNCDVLLIDPTSKAVKHFDEVIQYYRNKQLFTGGIQNDYYSCIQSLHPNLDKLKYINIGLWNKKEDLKFYKQTNEDYVSQSLVENIFGQKYDIVPVDSIKNIMEERGHSHIDLLKLDIEGAEIETVNQMLDDKIYPTYVLIEFDLLLKNKDPGNTTKQLIERMITKEGYKMLKNDNLNITFFRDMN